MCGSTREFITGTQMADNEELHLSCLDSRPVRAVLRYAALVVGCASVGVAFCFDLFAVYGETLKMAFGFSQKELAVIMSAAKLGMISALPSGLLVQKYDPRWLSGAAFILSTTSCLLIWGTTYHVTFYKEYFYVLAIFYFLLGCAGGFMYMLALSVNLLNFNKRHSGVISGIIHCMRSVVFGALLIVTDYINGRFESHPPAITVLPSGGKSGNTTATPGGGSGSRGWQEDILFLQKLFQLMLLVYGGVNFLACMFYGEYGDLAEGSNNCCDDGTENELVLIRTAVPIQYGTQTAGTQGTQTNTLAPCSINAQAKATTSADLSASVVGLEAPSTTSDTADLVTDPPLRPSGAPSTWSQLFKMHLFHQLLWPSVFLFAMRNTYVTNLSVIMASFGLTGDLRWVVYAVPIVGIITTPLLGLFADLLGHRVPRSLFYFLLAIGLVMLNLTNMGFAGVFPVVVLTVVWSQLAASCVQTLGPSLHLKFFNANTFSAGWGILMLLQTVLTLLTHFILAMLYDAFASTSSQICTGFKCYIVYFLFCTLLAYASAVCLFFVVRHEFETRPVTR